MQWLTELDLSMGTLGDEGAAALLAGRPLPHLSRLDLHHHYLSGVADSRKIDRLREPGEGAGPVPQLDLEVVLDGDPPRDGVGRGQGLRQLLRRREEGEDEGGQTAPVRVTSGRTGHGQPRKAEETEFVCQFYQVPLPLAADGLFAHPCCALRWEHSGGGPLPARRPAIPTSQTRTMAEPHDVWSRVPLLLLSTTTSRSSRTPVTSTSTDLGAFWAVSAPLS